MLEPILTFLPVLAMYLGAMASLSIDFNKRGSKTLLLLLPVLCLALTIVQFLEPSTIIAQPAANLVISKNNAFMVATCLAITAIILVNGFGDFSDKNVERFYHVLLFLIAGTVCGFLYADNLFILGTFILATEIFISILKFIYPSIDKKLFNALIATFTTGFISIMVGCLIIYNITGNAQYLYLESFGIPTVPPAAPVPPLAMFFLYAGFLIVFAAFPLSLLVHQGLHLRSHVSVKVFNLFLMSALYWKFLQVHDALNLTGIAFDATSFVLGMGNVVAGIVAISRELIARKQRRIELIVMASYIIDFGIMLALFGLMGDTAPSSHEIQQIIMLQVIITLATKVLFILSVKNITKVFHSDIIEDMEGLKLRRPITLAGYVMGTTGTVYLGIFILDAIYKILVEVPGSITGQVLFWAVLVTIMFTATWTAVLIAWIFGGKDLPASVQNAQPRSLRKEEATIVILIAFNVVVIVLAWLLPLATFLEPMMYGV